MSPVALSLCVALASTLVVAPFAIFLGAWLASARFAGKALVEAVLLLPLVLPPVVTGYVLLTVLSPLSLLFTRTAVVLAAAVVGFPLYVSAAKSAFARVDPALLAVARTLGHGERSIFFRFRLPLALPGLVAGAVLCFARALSEFGATTVVAGNIEGETRTIALAVYTLLDRPNGEAELPPLLFVSFAAAFVCLVLAAVVEKRR